MKKSNSCAPWIDFLKCCLIVPIVLVGFFVVIFPMLLYFQVLILLDRKSGFHHF